VAASDGFWRVADHTPGIVLRMNNIIPHRSRPKNQKRSERIHGPASPAPEVLKALVRANQNNVGIYDAVARIGRLAVAVTAPLPLRFISSTERDRPLLIDTRSWLENPRTPRPTSDVAL
jgi:hypothetical protein